RFHRVGEHGHDAPALGTAERGGEGAVARELALLEGHLSIALDAKKLHRRVASRCQVSGVGCQGMRASTGVANSVASSSPAVPLNSPPTMFSTMPASGEPRSRAARIARRTASRDSGVGIVTVGTAGGAGSRSH